jgi:S-adenosyl methyltransferase
VTILLVGVLHFVEDREDPWAVVNCYKDMMAPGSFLVISHVTADHLSPGAARQAQAVYDGASAPGVPRTREQIAGFFAGLDMVAPGLLNVSAWRPGHIGPPPGPALFMPGSAARANPGGRGDGGQRGAAGGGRLLAGSSSPAVAVPRVDRHMAGPRELLPGVRAAARRAPRHRYLGCHVR